MQNFGMTNKKYYGVLWYFLEWSIEHFTSGWRPPRPRPEYLKVPNSFTKRQAGVKKSCFSKQSIFCRCKGKTGDFPPKIERWWRFWIAEDGLSNLIYPNPIYPAAEGYSVPFLRDAAGLGQALAYIRPLQMDLDSSAVESAEQPEQVCVSNYSN